MTIVLKLRSIVVKMGFCMLLVMVAPSLSSQEIEGNGKDGTSLFSPADYVEVSTPLTDRISVNAYGFYLGNVEARIGLVELPLKIRSHLSLTPSYLFIEVPASGLSLLTESPENTDYREQQFRQAATVSASWHGLTVSDRNMYVRRFTSTGDLNRYRNKVYLARSIAVGTYRCSPFVFDEIYHDFAPGNWLRRNWAVAGVDMPVNGLLTFQVSYIRQDDQYLRSVNFLGVGLIVRPRKPFWH
jgi:hypothetical protein